MKNFLRILVWTVIALCIQHGVFLYLEYVYLDTDMAITVEKVEEEKVVNTDEDVIKIESNSENMSVSYDGKYLAYIKDGQLKIKNLDTDEVTNFNTETKGNIENYKWLSTQNIILVIQKIEERGRHYFQPISYNVSKNQERELVDFNYNKMIIPYNDGDKVDNIAFSTATHSLYIKTIKNNGLSDLYYSNVMNVVKKVRYNKRIGNIVVPSTNTNAVFELNDSVTVLNERGNITVPDIKINRLLGVDKNDKIYCASEENGNIEAIFYKNLESEEWNAYYLQEPVNKKDIIISEDGRIFINNQSEKYITELNSESVISYEGNVVGCYSDGIVSIDNGIITKYKFEDTSLLMN